MSNHKPIIGVTRPKRSPDLPWVIFWILLKSVGARPVKIRHGKNEEAIPDCDGFILSGGPDIHPSEYEKNKKSEPYQRHDLMRDKLERSVLEHAFEAKKPVFGICRGLQYINIFLGGSLHTDVKLIVTQAKYPNTLIGQAIFRKAVQFKKGSLFRKIFNAPQLRVNSLHHQIIDRLGKNLKVTATEHRDLVQGVEHKTHPGVFGVQWHPELMGYRPSQRRLFRYFVEQCKDQNGRKN